MFTTAIQDSFPLKTIVIIGDLVADQFLHGTIARVSREAPVFILRHDNTETVAGGAANAAVNVASLSGKAVLVGLVGKDETGKKLLQKLSNDGVNCENVFESSDIKTTTKVRVLAAQHFATRQQVIRIDYENPELPNEKLQSILRENTLKALKIADVIILSDYNYGVVTEEIAKLVIDFAKTKNIPVLVDSRNNLQAFKFATSATPNHDEVEQILGKNFTNIDCQQLCERLGFESLLITQGNKGMLLIEPGKPLVQIEAIGSKEPVDVTGAGDSVIATYALGIASGLDFLQAANLANHAGGIAVMKKGTASVSQKELLNSIKS